MIKHSNNLLENNNLLMGNIVRCFKDGSSLLYTWLSTLEGFPGSSVQFSRSVMSNFLQPHESQHARPPCPSPTPGVHPNPCPLSWWCHPTISSSVVPLSSLVEQLVKKVKVAHGVWLCDPMNDILHGILQAKTLEWVAFPFSSTSSQPRNRTRVSCIAGGFSFITAGKDADFALYQGLSTLALDILGNTFLWGLSYAL